MCVTSMGVNVYSLLRAAAASVNIQLANICLLNIGIIVNASMCTNTLPALALVVPCGRTFNKISNLEHTSC